MRITKFVDIGKLTDMTNPRGPSILRHVFFDDDIMVFCKETIRNSQEICYIFHEYWLNFGQWISCLKGKIMTRDINNTRIHFIANILGYSM